jgi:ubiquinone/menaquinone biosynthesis C-methylase UbiE
MHLVFRVVDVVYPHVERRAKTFGIQPGMTVVDYGCGPGRYTTRFARLVGEVGRVYAVDIHDLAIRVVRRKIARLGLVNVTPALVSGYDSGLPDDCADVVCAIDMFFGIKRPTQFLTELRRIAKPEGMLVIDDGHQPRAETKRKIVESGQWAIIEETKDHLRCRVR